MQPRPSLAAGAKDAVKLAFTDLQNLTGILPPPIPLLERGKNDQETLVIEDLVKATALDVGALGWGATVCSSAKLDDELTGRSVAWLASVSDGADGCAAGAMIHISLAITPPSQQSSGFET